MASNQNGVCIIRKETPRKSSNTSRHVGISQEVYEKLWKLSKESGRNIRYLCNELLTYAIDRTKITD